MVTGGPQDRLEKKGLTRRRITLGILLTAAVGAFGSLLTVVKVLAPKRSGGGYEASVAAGDRLVYAQGEKLGTPVQAASFKAGDAALTYPAGKTTNQANLVQLIRLEEGVFQPPTRLELTNRGFVAYSAVCTHLACTVSWVKNQASPSASFTECFCHNSIFDPSRGAKVLGGPAPIPLAQIGVKVAEDGNLIFTSGFSGPIGPQV